MKDVKVELTVCDGKVVYVAPEFDLKKLLEEEESKKKKKKENKMEEEAADSGFYLRRLKDGEEYKHVGLTMAKLELWNPGLYDYKTMGVVDPAGWFVGVFKQDSKEKIITSITCLKWNNNYSFVGNYICNRQERGKGYGIKTWKYGMRYLVGETQGDNKTVIALDAEQATIDTYKKAGFHVQYFSTRFSESLHVTEEKKRRRRRRRGRRRIETIRW